VERIDKAAASCFPPASRFGVIGFSDGGNMLNRLVTECVSLDATWIVSVGSEGNVPRAAPRDLKRCGRIRLIAGRSEATLLQSRGFARSLAARNADVRLVEHPGGHLLPLRETRQVLAELFGMGEDDTE
jgi:predicted esterase